MVHLPPKRLFRFIFNLREYCAVLLINQPDHTTPRSCEAKETLCCEIDSSESECYVTVKPDVLFLATLLTSAAMLVF